MLATILWKQHIALKCPNLKIWKLLTDTPRGFVWLHLCTDRIYPTKKTGVWHILVTQFLKCLSEAHIELFALYKIEMLPWYKYFFPIYLKELDTNTRKHELQQSCDNHDVTNSPNSDKDTLNNMLWGRRRKKTISIILFWRLIIILNG